MGDAKMRDKELEKEPPTDDFDQSSSTRPEEEDVEKASLRRHLTAASASGAAPVAEAAPYKNDAADGDPNAVGWEGPDDPASPLNWPQKRKWANIGALSVMTILT